jgi:small subunit ribosomal protein S19
MEARREKGKVLINTLLKTGNKRNNMARSIKKGPFVDPNVLKKMERAKKGDPIKTWSRKCIITPEMIGHVFLVHNGKNFLEVKPTESMVGHKLGEFSPSTRFDRHGGKMQRELEKRAKEREREERKKEKQAS